MSKQLEAEGVKEIAIITDEIEKYGDTGGFAKNSKVYDRKNIIDVQIELSRVNGTTVIIRLVQLKKEEEEKKVS